MVLQERDHKITRDVFDESDGEKEIRRNQGSVTTADAPNDTLQDELAHRILCVLGQGVWSPPDYLCEYPADSSVYLEHVSSALPTSVATKANLVVLCGSSTQAKAPGVTEAAGMHAYLRANGLVPIPIIEEGTSLDTAEQVITPLAQTRVAYGWNGAIAKCAISPCWGPKIPRIEAVVNLLGIEDFVTYVPFDPDGSRAANSEALREGERRFFAGLDGDWLMLSERFEEKRRRRYCGATAFESRWDHFLAHPRLRPLFELLLSAHHTQEIPRDVLRATFREAIGPFA